MPRRREVPKRDIAADPLNQSALVSKFINCVMSDGKRSTAERILYKSFDIIKAKTSDDPLKAFNKVIDNVKRDGAKVIAYDVQFTEPSEDPAQDNALIEADLTGNSPAYHATGNVTALPWKGGKMDADLSVDTSGSGFAAPTADSSTDELW